ncbi:uncharacterized protein LOC111386130 [Olea europaea var. sylvestris]|uniref:uncharacterized protein LOC111386130 n=1 Tax=Olea europaea var. sylvestris TaxID=158386 RepID=UPI000C1D0522|nr:uncharacterized protein LOC111386130 [Olea europaea var. sylvestris]
MAVALTGRALGSLPSNMKINPKEHAKVITTRSGKQLPKIRVKRSGVNQETKSPTMEDPIEHDEQIEESIPAEKPCKTQGKATINPHEPSINFPQRLKKQKLEQQYKKFLEVFKKLHINIPLAQYKKFLEIFKKLHINIQLADVLFQMPSYAKFLKDMLLNKCKLGDHKTVMLMEKYSARIQKKLQSKLKDPRSFTIPYTIVKLADRSLTQPKGIIEDLLIKVVKFIFPMDFLILDMEEDKDISLILGILFLPIWRALIDVQNGQLILRLGEEQILFNIFKTMKLSIESDSCFQIDVIDKVVQDSFLLHNLSDAYEAYIVHSQSMQFDSVEIETCARFLDTNQPYTLRRYFEELRTGPTKPLPSIQQPPKLELKQLQPHLRYAYLGESCTLLVIISNIVSEVEEDKLLRVLKENKIAIGWTIADIKGISPSLCMHKILMDENYRPTIESQRRLNPTMKKLVRAELQEKITFPFHLLIKCWRDWQATRITIFSAGIQEKRHFMKQEGIVLGHLISAKGIEVDKAKIQVIKKLLSPTSVKEAHSFLGHTGFYKRFIKDF